MKISRIRVAVLTVAAIISLSVASIAVAQTQVSADQKFTAQYLRANLKKNVTTSNQVRMAFGEPTQMEQELTDSIDREVWIYDRVNPKAQQQAATGRGRGFLGAARSILNAGAAVLPYSSKAYDGIAKASNIANRAEYAANQVGAAGQAMGAGQQQAAGVQGGRYLRVELENGRVKGYRLSN